MTRTPDLDAYFARIGFQGSARPDLATLQAIHLLHPNAIAFENLNPLLGLPVPLDIESLEQKMVRGRRGGWCFEHNTLLKHVLSAIGFEVEGLIARVLWGQPEDRITSRSHMLMRVRIDGADYIADVGFGGNVLTAPLRLEPELEQSTPHQPFRLVQLVDGFKMQSKIAGAWTTMYRFDLHPQTLVDYEVSSHFVETHPSSIFLSNLLAGRATPDRRYGLWNNQLNSHVLDGVTSRTLASGDEIRDVLENIFLVSVPSNAEAALQKLAQP